jgi:nitrogen fixation/metabolism regulation signal transduction histidine kinase
LAAAILLSTQLHRFISRPVLALAQTADEVATRKDYSVRAIKRSHDEIGHLVDRFNEMLTQIESRDAALQEARNQLEQRVTERTAELSQTNDKL